MNARPNQLPISRLLIHPSCWMPLAWPAYSQLAAAKFFASIALGNCRYQFVLWVDVAQGGPDWNWNNGLRTRARRVRSGKGSSAI
jgi:hypothetical protein